MELLAPARDLAALAAAIDAGADAVYCGLKKFSARKRAQNFTGPELLRAVELVKKAGKRMYVTLNTLIFESEIPELIETLVFLENAQVDALIIQDYGIYQMVRDLGLTLPLHASTQTGTKNHIHARFLEDLGFRRVILERQLSLSEIESIRGRTGIELEVFIHGALCYALSGCCFFSRKLTGRSGNRGECAQPCRWQFRNSSGQDCYPFSMKDLDGIRYLPALQEIGVNSLKIEGRMKGVDYVYPVVSAYRKALDLLSRERLTARDMEELQREIGDATLSRNAAGGFFDGSGRRTSLVDFGGGAAGLYAGKAAAVFDKAIYFKTGVPFRVGDTLRVTDKKTDKRFKLPVKAIYLDSAKARDCAAGSYVGVPSPHRDITAGSKIYLVHRRLTPAVRTDAPGPSPVRKERGDRVLEYLLGRYRELYCNGEEDASVENAVFDPAAGTVEIFGEKALVVCPDVFENSVERYRAIARSGEKAVCVSHPGEPALFRGKRCYGSFFLYATNAAAVRFMKNQGIAGLSVPADMDDHEFVLVRPRASRWVRWKNLPLWITRVESDKEAYTLETGKRVRIEISGSLGVQT